MDLRDRVRGCLLGGAVGDALGAPVEFSDLADIRRRFGPSGIADYVEAYGRVGAITDDTQLTLFTCEGLVRAHVRRNLKGICAPEAVIQHAYLRWLLTQGVKPSAAIATIADWPDGWLVGERRLWSRRAPGNTCISALEGTTKLGERATNESKGCGTVMRVAPIGLVCPAHDGDRSPAFELGEQVSAVTHGHPAAIMGGGAFALLIAHLADGVGLRRAVDAMLAQLEPIPGAGFVTRALDMALKLVNDGDEPTPEKIETLGGGWVAEEALAIATYCALVARDFEHGVRLAVNHSGDSDSTGSMTGQILGTAWGAEVIPARWLDAVELRDVIERMVDDLLAVRNGTLDAEAAWSSYPGW